MDKYEISKFMDSVDPEEKDLMTINDMEDLISGDLSDKIMTGSKIFKHLEQQFPEIAEPGKANLYDAEMKGGIGIKHWCQ